MASNTQTADALLAINSGRGFRSGQSTTTTLGQVLDMYVIHWGSTLLFFVGGIILMDRYGFYTTAKNYSAWDDFFFAIGALALAINLGFLIAFPITWAIKQVKFLDREDDSVHWLHALSIFASLFAGGWGLLALILTFGSTLDADVADSVEVAGYFLVMLSTIYSFFIVFRYILGLAGREIKPAATVQPALSADVNTMMSALRASYAATPSTQPIFSGGGAAAFGGLDLSGFQPSSISTVPQAAPVAVAPGYGGGYGGGCPMIIMPQVAPAGQSCAVDTGAVTL